MTAPRLTDLEPLDEPLPKPPIPLFSRWKHVEGEEVVVIDLEEGQYKGHEGKWVDLVRYGVPSMQRTFSRTRPNFLERFSPVDAHLVPAGAETAAHRKGVQARLDLAHMAEVAGEYLKHAGHAETCLQVEVVDAPCTCGRDELAALIAGARGAP